MKNIGIQIKIFFYAGEIKDQQLVVKTTEQRADFLPWLFYISERGVLLDIHTYLVILLLYLFLLQFLLLYS